MLMSTAVNVIYRATRTHRARTALPPPVCGAVPSNDVWRVTLTSPPSRMVSVWSGPLPSQSAQVNIQLLVLPYQFLGAWRQSLLTIAKSKSEYIAGVMQ